MSYTLKQSESEAELTITVTPIEYQSALAAAASRLAARASLPGFRQGHVPVDMIKKEVGEMSILQEALESIVQSSFVAAVSEANIETIGMPKINIQKVAPGNDLIYTATVATLPSVTLPDISAIAVSRPKAEVPPTAVGKVIDELRAMQAIEVIQDGPAEATNKVVVDMSMTQDRVAIDGGTAKDYGVYLGDDHYIPGFNKELIGLKAGDAKTFTLTFPDTHYQKMLAGKPIDITVTVKSVFTRTLPEANDDFAKKLGAESMAKLRELMNKNLRAEADEKAEQQFTIALWDAVVAATNLPQFPQLIVDAEKQKMFYELKRDLDRHGVAIEQYLSDIKKTEAEIFADFQSQAEKRATASLISRQIAKEQNLSVDKTEIDAEIERIKAAYKDSQEDLANLTKPEVRDSIATILQNKKVLAWLKEKVKIQR